MSIRAAAILAVAPCAWVAAQPARDAAPAAPRLEYSVSDADLQRLQPHLGAALHANRKQFAGRLGPVAGFGAGETYPQIWMRDSATLVPLARWLYPRERLTSWVEEHLAAQQPDGALFDWIAAGEPAHFREWAPQAREIFRSTSAVLTADTNTTEADQESSAVLAASRAFAATGDVAWLLHPVAGEALIARLDRALESLVRRRLDKRLGLLVNALTADWGDVSPAYPDQRAIYLDERTPRAAGLYTNALFVEAARALALLHAHTGNLARAADWGSRAASVAADVDGLLWQEARGFYAMHVVTTPQLAAGFPDTSDLFALGGNAHAILAGIAADARAERIFDVAGERRHAWRLATIAHVLVPPLPARAFTHPALASEWEYQNGGQWDWIAGRFVLAEFHRGRSEAATRQLAAIARRAVGAGGLYEWYTRDGRGRGSPTYAGAAGALGQALIEGLFGVSLDGARLDLTLRLGALDGGVRLRQAATGTRVEYRYAYDRARHRTVIDYRSDAAVAGRLAVRLPAGLRAGAAARDGEPQRFRIEAVGNDVFAVVDTDWKPHRLVLSLTRTRR